LLLSFILPILGYRWYIEPNGARDETVEHVASDFGLAIEGQDAPTFGRTRDRFSHIDYLRHALLKLSYGFMFDRPPTTMVSTCAEYDCPAVNPTSTRKPPLNIATARLNQSKRC
jgi:hypothetical protein